MHVLFLPIQGNYDSYIKTRAELEENQMKQYSREQDQIKHMKVCSLKKGDFLIRAFPKCSTVHYLK